MKLGQLFVVAALLLSTVEAAKVYGPSEEALPPVGPKIRVLIAHAVPSALVEAKGAYRVIRPESGTQISLGLVGKRYIVHAIDSGLRWGEEYPDVSQFTIYPANRQTIFYVNGYQYKGSLSVYLDQNHRVTIVNEVPIEDYLQATLALKLDRILSSEAMSAMTIAARTEAYAATLSGRSSKAPWDVKATDVGYFGNGVALQKNQVEKIVENTRFIVMEAANGSPIASVRLIASKVEELAQAGQDAKRILNTCYPHMQLNVTTDPTKR